MFCKYEPLLNNDRYIFSSGYFYRTPILLRCRARKPRLLTGPKYEPVELRDLTDHVVVLRFTVQTLHDNHVALVDRVFFVGAARGFFWDPDGSKKRLQKIPRAEYGSQKYDISNFMHL